ncbi:zinc finger protein Xfin [Scaptodrosophila lebanonensis]|uniref:Zinc finger protein Xfin n=1 Tax=Drosophila lebanonensis TaxID=7225 RepID=A0A6J2U7N0_DROLE|nr:zinc finger protein Xfin [Scaptodrosophila lebanonensis]
MELALSKTSLPGNANHLDPSSCADCCTDCVGYSSSACCTAACCGPNTCCDVNCELMRSSPILETRYEYHEPEDNFVSIDDDKIKSLLLKIGQQQQEEDRLRQQQHQQIIELIDDDERNDGDEQFVAAYEDDGNNLELRREESPVLRISTARSLRMSNTMPTKRQSPDIQLIPRVSQLTPAPERRIVAEIELLDSDSEQEDDLEANQLQDDGETDDDEELPLAAAAALSCELQLPDGESEDKNEGQVIVLHSDDEQDIRPAVTGATMVQSTRSYVKRRGRHLYECLACGKKVQSNYNLRRHMMIHTGERPFACDLCERRFREFSDLKKHRRRHANEPHFLCMICRVQTPTEQDSTRCAQCEGKNLLLKPQVNVPGSSGSSDHVGEAGAEEYEDDRDDEVTVVAATPTPVTRQPAAAAASPVPVITITALPAPTEQPPTLLAIPTLLPLPPRSCSSNSSSASNEALPPPLSSAASQRPRQRSRKAYPCPLCQRPFGTRHNLKRHFMIHTGEKPFSCNKCRKPFRECSTLKKHMVTHVRERWYKCLRCPQKFQDYLDYTAHKSTHLSEQMATSVHKELLDSGEDSFDGCDMDSVETWLECCECNRRFTELDSYTDHLKQHNKELYGMTMDDDEEDQDVDVA